MTSIRNVVATMLVGGACLTGLTACGDETISDQGFIDGCKDGIDDTPALKAYAEDICKCAQDKLKAQGLGDSSLDNDADKAKGAAATAACLKEVAGGA